MHKCLTTLLIAGALGGSLAAATAVMAEEPEQAPGRMMEQGMPGMMGQGMMGEGMMPMMGMMGEMREMMQTCTRMMQAMLNEEPREHMQPPGEDRMPTRPERER
jgi:periplasmic protein CpxP/Spy